MTHPWITLGVDPEQMLGSYVQTKDGFEWQPDENLLRSPVTTELSRPRRPRFTRSEAVLFNALVNAAPRSVSLAVLAKIVWPLASTGSIPTLIGTLRAKLGEDCYHHRLLITIYHTPHGRRATWGYRWTGEDTNS